MEIEIEGSYYELQNLLKTNKNFDEPITIKLEKAQLINVTQTLSESPTSNNVTVKLFTHILTVDNGNQKEQKLEETKSKITKNKKEESYITWDCGDK